MNSISFRNKKNKQHESVFKHVLMKLWITHVAQVPDEIALLIQHHIPDRPFLHL
jgi:hypothetical protein